MQCTCGRKAVYHRRQSGQYLCEICFSKSIKKKFRQTIRKHSYVNKDEKIAVGVSGGKDSTVLLHLLHELNQDRPFELGVIIIDEGIAKYRDKSMAIAKKACQTLDVPYHVFSFQKEFEVTMDEVPEDVPHCSYCGVLRRYLLNQKSRMLGYEKLAVGLNLDDEVQSILMNFLRGDLFRFGRTGPYYTEKQGFVPRIKPLREILEKEIMLYAVVNNISVDHSVCPYAFEAYRGDIRDFLNSMESKRPTTKYSLLRSYEKLFPHLQQKLSSPVSFCEKCGEPTVDNICKTCTMIAKIHKIKKQNK